jgi:DNA-binding response OmpR family regulator
MSKKRILIVDDNLPVARLVGSRLEKTECYEIWIENVPLVARQAAKRFQPDLFLLDVEMPGKNGIELVRELRDDGFEKTPVLFLTSLVSADEAGSRELVSGGHRYLSKSATVDVLHDCITRALNETLQGAA